MQTDVWEGARMRSLVAACVLLSACSAAEPPISLEAARTQLSDLAAGRDADAFCSPEGRREFRAAVRALAAAQEASGARPSELMETSDPVWALVFIGVVARIVEPSDLRGEHRAEAARLRLADFAVAGFDERRDVLEGACPELIALYRAAADVERLEARLQALDNREGPQARSLGRQLLNAHERAERAMREINAKMEAANVDL